MNVPTAPANRLLPGFFLGLVHSIVKLLEQLIAGAVVSITVTVKLHPFVFRLRSYAWHITVVAPKANTVPDAGLQTIVGFTSHTSVAVVPNVAVTPAGLVHSIVKLLEQVITGAVVSNTVTVKSQLLGFRLESNPLQVTMVVPNPNTLPEAGVHTTVGLVSHRSETVVTKLTVAPDCPVHSTVKLLEQVIVGAVVSTIVTTKLQVFVF